ncbi:MAG: thiamine diphosphokinase [Velocimicrobium sp.]
MDNNCFLIVTGGNLSELFIREFVEHRRLQGIICVDGALALVDKMKLSIDYLVGDFDTVSSELIAMYRQRIKIGEIKTKIYEYHPEKDETDTQIAISLALKLGAKEICVMGAIGTRMDHVLANIHLLLQPLEKKVYAYILDEHNRIYLKNNSFCLEKDKMYGTYLSLIPLGGNVEAVTLTGFKYNTDSIDFLLENSFGISNELLLEKGQVSFRNGTFIVIEAND